MMVLGAFWIATAWPSGSTLTLNAAAVCALASSSPDPKRSVFQMAAGTLVASVMGMLAVYGVFPRIDGFPLLCAALAPFLLFGVFMTTRPALAGWGVGYCIFFCFLAGPDNVMHYDPSAFINDAIALVRSPCCCRRPRRGCATGCSWICGARSRWRAVHASVACARASRAAHEI
jgi:uncharacterized membrane protein YccC